MASEKLKKVEELQDLVMNPYDASQLCVVYQKALVLKKYSEGNFVTKVIKFPEVIGLVVLNEILRYG